MTGDAEFLAAVMPHREVMALLAARLAPYAAPGKVARDAYALAVRHRSDFDQERAGLRSWLLAVTAQCADAARPRRGRAATTGSQLPSAEASIRRSALMAMDSLPDRQRFAVECVHFVDLSIRETAELMRVPERSVRSALVDGQRRISSLPGSDGGPGSGGGGADQLSAAGSAWRAAFRELPRADLQEFAAPPNVSAADHPQQPSSVEVVETVGSPMGDDGSPQTEPRPRRQIRTRWVLTAIGVVVLIAGGTAGVLTAKRASEIAAADQAHRAFQHCGEIPPGLGGVTVRRLGKPTEDSFRVRVVADRSMTVVSATVTGVDQDGRIATYVEYDDSAELQVSVVKIEGAGHPMVIQSFRASDPCDSSPSSTPELTDHLLLVAVGDGATALMDAGPVDGLSLSDS